VVEGGFPKRYRLGKPPSTIGLRPAVPLPLQGRIA